MLNREPAPGFAPPSVLLGALLIAFSFSAQAQSSLTLAWSPSAGAASYNLYQGTASGSYSAHVAAAATNATVSGLLPGATYYFAATAVDTAGLESDYSAEIVYSIPPATITNNSLVTIWPANAVPKVADVGADSAVELGVKFKSDVSGSVVGIRFYKCSLNTGTHVGNLWSSSGTLLATATFTGETASGWQQVLFSQPVAITANTVYIASYHANAGHFCSDQGAFASAGVDNAPLHALATGTSGGNGVYAYGAGSSFPSQTWNSCNYWVDVLVQTTTAPPPPPTPTLTSIAVSPANPCLATGCSQQFTATGTYSDGSTQNLTTQAAWTSSAASVATVSAGGLASTLATGSATLSATLGGITGSSALDITNSTVLPAPWQTVDIGKTGRAGSAVAANGNFTVAGAGNLSGAADNFRFLYQPLSGDGEIKVRLGSQSVTNAAARAGVMIRETLTAGSRYAFMGAGGDRTVRWQRRSTTSGSTSSSTSGTSTNAWIRLTRTNNTLYGFKSTNGVTWTRLTSARITMATNIYVGFAVASGATNTLDTAVFNTATIVP
jgi:hypothetical protein